MTTSDRELLPFIRAVRNAPATILLLLIIARRSMTAKHISLLTSYSDKTVQSGLASLEALSFVKYDGRAGWTLVPGSCSSLLAALDSDSEIVNFPISSSSYIHSYFDLMNVEEGEEEEKERVDRTVYDLLVTAGIGRSSVMMRRLLAANLSPEFVLSHVEAARRDGIPTGYLINRLLDGNPPPDPSSIPAQYKDIIRR